MDRVVAGRVCVCEPDSVAADGRVALAAAILELYRDPADGAPLLVNLRKTL